MFVCFKISVGVVVSSTSGLYSAKEIKGKDFENTLIVLLISYFVAYINCCALWT